MNFKRLEDLKPDPQLPPEKWPELLVVAATIFGEARGESLEAKLGVGLVIRNRVNNPAKWDGTDWKGVCLKPWQFSCWNANDPNRKKLAWPLEHEPAYVWLECLAAARMVMEPGLIHDRMTGADHYYDFSLDLAGKPPDWANKYTLIRQIGRLKFFRSVT